jgi:EAL domain-containing protein (putative c-di-GMP-specific phosphodiesterase class I)
VTGDSGVAGVLDEFDQILDTRQLRTVLQPIVHLASGVTIGYESLVRGPEGSALSSAGALLAAAYRAGRVVEFDWAARASACRAALDADMDRDHLLFMNVEPLALDSDCPRDLWRDIETAFAKYRIVMEVTERSLDRDPGTLLDGLDRVRRLVEGFAIDDVGSEPATLAMMPLIAPAVIKLDVTVTQADSPSELAKILDIVYEEAERTGAIILAEGIENSGQLRRARTIGATLGQGFHLGAPASAPAHARRPIHRLELSDKAPLSIGTPMDAVRGRVTGRADAELLVPLCRRIEKSIQHAPVPALLISLVPEPHLFDAQQRRLYARLAHRGATTAVVGPGIPAEPGGDIRGVGLRWEAPIENQWAVVALSPSSAGAMLARVADGHPGFDFTVTHETDRVIAAARCLFRRLGAPIPQWTPETAA